MPGRRFSPPDFSELAAWLPVATRLAEMSIAAPQVIAMRSAQMLYSGSLPSARDQRELYLMFGEKAEALSESMMAMWLHWLTAHQAIAASFFRFPWQASWPWPDVRTAHGRKSLSQMVSKGIDPLHRRVTANAVRLARARR